MVQEKNIAVVGLSDEETAHLRLLIRMAAPQLQHHWHWGTETNADLVIVDLNNFSGQMAWNRAKTSGRHCVILSDCMNVENNIVLQRPFKLANLISVLNEGDFEVQDNPLFVQQNDGFYELDGLELNTEVVEQDSNLSSFDFSLPNSPTSNHNPEELNIDALLAQAEEPPPVPVTSIEDWSVEAIPKRTASSLAATEENRSVRNDANHYPHNSFNSQNKSEHSQQAQQHTLLAYLQDALLNGPARYTLDQSPTLFLDPKNQNYHVEENTLLGLSAYCDQLLPMKYWRTLTMGELNPIRHNMPAQPYSRLVWLYTLRHSNGKLASHLDPGGRYRLKSWPLVEPEFPQQERIANLLMQSYKLEEITERSGTTMTVVINFVNAYDAIGMLQVEPRASRYPEKNHHPSELSSHWRKWLGKA